MSVVEHIIKISQIHPQLLMKVHSNIEWLVRTCGIVAMPKLGQPWQSIIRTFLESFTSFNVHFLQHFLPSNKLLFLNTPHIYFVFGHKTIKTHLLLALITHFTCAVNIKEFFYLPIICQSRKSYYSFSTYIFNHTTWKFHLYPT